MRGQNLERLLEEMRARRAAAAARTRNAPLRLAARRDHRNSRDRSTSSRSRSLRHPTDNLTNRSVGVVPRLIALAFDLTARR